MFTHSNHIYEIELHFWTKSLINKEFRNVIQNQIFNIASWYSILITWECSNPFFYTQMPYLPIHYKLLRTSDMRTTSLIEAIFFLIKQSNVYRRTCYTYIKHPKTGQILFVHYTYWAFQVENNTLIFFSNTPSTYMYCVPIYTMIYISYISTCITFYMYYKYIYLHIFIYIIKLL